MAQPTPTSPLSSPSHSTLHKFHINVKAFGAMGDNSNDDTAEIQAAIDSAPPAGAGIGEVYFPPGVYKLSGSLVLPTSSPRIVLRGPANMAKGAAAGAYLRQTSANSDTIQVDTPASTHSYVFDGLHIVYDTRGTGIGVNVAVAADPPIAAAHRFKDMVIHQAGTGIKIGGTVGPEFDNVSVNACGIGIDVTHSSGTDWNLAHFDHCYFRSNVTAGLRLANLGAMFGPGFRDCVFESNTGPGILVDTGSSALRQATFTNCWWEAGDKGIVFKGGAVGLTFEGCRFIQTNDFMVIDAALNSSVDVSNVTMIGCHFTTGTGSKLMTHTAATDAQDTNDPRYTWVNILGHFGSAPIKGLATPVTGSAQVSMFQGASIQESDILSNSVTGERPSYVLLTDPVKFTNKLSPIMVTGVNNNIIVRPSDDTGPANGAMIVQKSSGEIFWYVAKNGTLNWGDGAGTIDTTLYRSAPNILKTDDTFLANVAGLGTKHEGAATPTGGTSGEIRVGNGKIWVNDAGTWKSVAVA